MDSRQPASKRKSFRVRSLQDIETISTGGEFDMTKRRKIETNPLFLEDIVEKIFSYLDIDSIKSARQVHESWSAEGARILLSKCFVQIPSDLQHRVSFRTNRTVHKFQAFLSYKSVIPKITVKSKGDVELWKSLGKLGPQVNSLKLKHIDGGAEFLHNLLDLLPNLKYLTLEDSSEINRNNVTILKVLNSVMSKAEKDQNPLIIRKLTLQPFDVEQLEDIEEFAGSYKNILFEELSFAVSFMDLKDIHVNEILDRVDLILDTIRSKSQNTLKYWSEFRCFDWMVIKLPSVS